MPMNGAAANKANVQGSTRRSSPNRASATSPLTQNGLRSRIANSEFSCILSCTALLDDALRLAAGAFLDRADRVDRLARRAQLLHRALHVAGRDHDHHAAAAVEDAVHLVLRDIARALQPAEHLRLRP